MFLSCRRMYCWIHYILYMCLCGFRRVMRRINRHLVFARLYITFEYMSFFCLHTIQVTSNKINDKYRHTASAFALYKNNNLGRNLYPLTTHHQPFAKLHLLAQYIDYANNQPERNSAANYRRPVTHTNVYYILFRKLI